MRPEKAWDFSFDAGFAIIPGKTTTSDLNRKYPAGPRKRISFPGGFMREHETEQILVDQIWIYGEAKTSEKKFRIEAGQMARQEITLETLTLAVFLSEGTVTGHSITHRVRVNGNSEFSFGRFNTGNVSPNEVYPGSQKDMRRYARLRGKEWACDHGFYEICDANTGSKRTEGNPVSDREKRLLETEYSIEADEVVMVDSYRGRRNRDGARVLVKDYMDNKTGLGYKLEWLLDKEEKISKFCGFSSAVGPCAPNLD
ncbi:MAG: hypothetical protein RH862_07640 [Leptospiraceae bacterium]